MFTERMTRAQVRTALGPKKRAVFFEVEDDGRLTFLPAFTGRNCHPKWAARLRGARAAGIGLPFLATHNGKLVNDYQIGILGSFSD